MTHPTEVVRNDSRRAGDVLRYHGWPTLQPQTNAHHSWNVCRILTTIWPDAPARVILRALHHDDGELGSGDLPFPVKARNPELKLIMDRLERQSLRDQGTELPIVEPEWRDRIKMCDMIEMFEKGLDEVLLGNRYAWAVIRGICEWLEEQQPEPLVREYLRGRWTRYYQVCILHSEISWISEDQRLAIRGMS